MNDHRGHEPRVGIVVLNYNGTFDTMRCLESLQLLDYDNCFTIVVDNGSKPCGGIDFVQVHPWTTLIQLETNQGWAGGNNAGIRVAMARGADYILLLNNDTVVSPQLVSRLISSAANAPGYAVLGPLVCWMDNTKEVMMDGCFFNLPNQNAFFRRELISVSPAGASARIADVEIVYGCCIMLAAEVFHRIGFLDERFFLIHEESDFCLRARQAGFRCGVLAEPLVWHKGSSSFQREPRPLQRYFDARNLYLLVRKQVAKSRYDRSAWRTWLRYWRHVYYMYCLQRERQNDLAARAVLDGMSDGMLGHFGPMLDRRRPVVPLFRWLFDRYRDLSCLLGSASTSNCALL